MMSGKQHEIRHTDGGFETKSASFFTIFAVSFVLFATIAVVGSALGWQWRSWLPGAEGVKSMTGGVKSAVYTFMSHLQ